MQQTEGDEVATCETCDGDGIVYVGDLMVGCDSYMTERPCPACRGPRAVVAISEDRQWLVSLRDIEGESFWLLWQWNDMDSDGWVMQVKATEDTGQDAHEVLATFLRERGG